MIEEKIIVGAGAKFPLNGLLTIPSGGSSPYPAVVLVHGSGPNDMDEKVGNTYCFKDLAKGLAKHGIATIRYHKRTFVYGKEMAKNSDDNFTVWEETIEDALFAAELLRKDPRINSEKIFALGHSMGGMLLPRIDADGGNFAGLIIWAASPRRLEEIIIDQQDDFLKRTNFIMKWIVGKQIVKLRKKFDKMYAMPDEEAKATPLFGKHNKVYYLKEWGLKPSVDYLKVLSKPILIMQGDADFHVSVEKDFERYKEILASCPQASFKLYPNLNHLFMPSIYGDITQALKEYKVAQKVEEYVISDIADWIYRRQ
jgi:dienelactone hydrolase